MLNAFNPFKKNGQNYGKPTFPVLLTQGSDSMYIKQWDLVSGPEPSICMTMFQSEEMKRAVSENLSLNQIETKKK